MKEKTEKKEVRKQLLITESLDKRFREHMTEVARERKGIVSFNKYVAELMERAIEGKY